MNKDVIYIDVEDDITAIIGKVKASSSKIVALVPPKRIGVLQSAVNLRLLQRAATQGGKHLVLISGNSALGALAAAAKIPVAKNLQSKPEVLVSEPVAEDEGEDLIDGSQLPVGELARTADGPVASSALVGGAAAIDAAVKENAAEEAPLRPVRSAVPVAKAKSGVKVPNFDVFRKKLFLIIGGGILLIGFLIWSIFFAAHATVIISAQTTASPVDAQVTFDPSLSTSLQNGTLKSVTKQITKNQTVNFTATGSKQVGTSATGTMSLSRTSPSATPLTVPAGTQFTDPVSGLVFTSTESVTLVSQLTPGGFDPGSGSTPVQAAAIGDNYNLSSRSYNSSVNGVNASGSDMAGGSQKTVTVVSQDDITKATAQLTQQNSDSMKQQLTSQFDSTYVVVDSTFKTNQAQPTSNPAADTEDDSGQATLTSSVTYALSAVPKDELKQYLDAYFASKLNGTTDQRVYDDGVASASFANVTSGDKGVFSANLVATGKIGPNISDQAVKAAAAGKRYGEIQAALQTIQGVNNVDVNFSPFWVSTAPTDTNRISVQFKLNGTQ